MAAKQIDPRVEVSGAPMLSLIQNINADETKSLLAKHGLVNLTAEGWYPAQKWFDIFDDINNGDNSSANLVAIGMAVVDTAKTPPGFEEADLPAILALWNEHYHLNHRSPIDIGAIRTERRGDKHIVVELTTLYPDDLCYGMTFAYARRTLPKGTHFTVKYDEQEPRIEKGGTRTLVHVTWD
jgi:hypothetical protein